ncbi:DUF3558 domain-containing protein [Saccharomonospora cyanea]|uniref:DUF3558 domain-containing protein n=1 Tax=Saccharomonospora cyanea TaxID=40989 RepID=UPI0005BB7F54|nr:DUF3558 domain-containing protein [Saccharomonospora cyanea]
MRNHPFWFRIVPVLAVAAVGVSCSADTDGVAQPATGELSASKPSAAPERRVSDPLDVAPYLSRPCDLVSPEMLERLGTSPSEATPRLPEDDKITAQTGPGCSWTGENEGSVGIGIDSGNKERGVGGLRGLEIARDQGRYKLWEETSIAGYPAVYMGVRDARHEGDCDLAVGIADDMTFGVSAVSFRENPQKACEVAVEVAADVIENLKAGN